MTMRILDTLPTAHPVNQIRFVIDKGIIQFDEIYTVPLRVANRWCSSPYPNHPRGCPNCKQCANKFGRRMHASQILNLQATSAYNIFTSSRPMFLVYITFDLNQHEQWMKDRHPTWTRRQCRNLLYWQPKLDKAVYNMACEYMEILKKGYPKDYMMIGEGFGINVYRTCLHAGLKLQGFRSCSKITKLIMLLPAAGHK